MALLWCLLSVAWIIGGGNSEQVIIKNVTEWPTVIEYLDDVNCSSEATRWQLQVQQSGLGLTLFLNQSTLDPDNEELLILSTDASMDGSKASVAYITGNLSNVAYAVPLAQIAYLDFSAKEPCSPNINFTVTVLQYEEAVPEPEPTLPSPYPPSNVKTGVLIYLAGKTLDEYSNGTFITAFKEYMHEAAYKFAVENAIEGVVTKLPNETVFLTDMKMCSNKWERYDTCVELMMAIYLTEPNANQYELTVTHVQRLWDQIHATGLPQDLGVQPYEFPDISTGILWWILWLFIAIALTLGLGFVFWRWQRKAVTDELILREMLEEDRRNEILAQVELRKKPNQFRMSKHQKIPEFMLNDTDEASVLSVPVITPDKPIIKSSLKLAHSSVANDALHSPSTPSPAAIGSAPVFFAQNMGFQEEDEAEYGNEDVVLRC